MISNIYKEHKLRRNNKLMTTDEVAKYLNISRNYVISKIANIGIDRKNYSVDHPSYLYDRRLIESIKMSYDHLS